ncbi:MAG: NADH-quinone oxidoreductase subunit N, partial [bacterium]
LVSILSVAALVGAAVFAATTFCAGTSTDAFDGLYRADSFGSFAKILIYIAAAISLVIAPPALEKMGAMRAEYPVLVILAATGMGIMVSATDLITLYIGLELNSLAAYVLASFARNDERSVEAGLKYFVLGALASGILLYGMSLVYGFTGTTAFEGIARAFGAGLSMGQLFGLVFVFAGLAFKMAAVPFHMWTPDVYEGAPTPVTAFMATAVKAAAFGALLRFVWAAAGAPGLPDLTPTLSVLAIITMTVGNLGALTQPNVKRMLAFSSIAHAGYLLVGVAAIAAARRAGGLGDAAPILYYLLAYAVTNLAAFGVVIALGNQREASTEERTRIDSYAGAARRNPAIALVMAVAMLSLAGVPPTAGFLGKYMLFREAVAQGLTPLVVWGVLNSALSLYYYLGLIVVMYMKPEREPVAIVRGFALRTVLVLLALAVLWGGIAPAGSLPGLPDLVRWAETSIASR